MRLPHWAALAAAFVLSGCFDEHALPETLMFPPGIDIEYLGKPAKLYGTSQCAQGQLTGNSCLIFPPHEPRATGVILSAAYALWLYRRVVMGELVKEALKSITDMTRREKAIFAPLVAMTLLLGVYPALVTDIIGPSVGALITDYQAALPAPGDTQLAQN